MGIMPPVSNGKDTTRRHTQKNVAEETTRGMGTELLKYSRRSLQCVLFSSPVITARPTDVDS